MEISTLTFDEYLSMKKYFGKELNPNLDIELSNYIYEGGFPQAVKYDTIEQKRLYVQSVVNEIFQKDIDKSKRSLYGEEKYYLTDLSFFFLRNTDNRIPYGPVLENIVYQYAKSIGNSISIGKIKNLEVDFILRKPDMSYAYVQVARYIDNGNIDENGNNLTEEREYRSLEAINDNYPKYLLTMDHLLQHRNGIIHENLAEFISSGKHF